LELHPSQDLWLEGVFSRLNINPTYTAATFDLLAEGWQADVDWRPGQWSMYAHMLRQHYSDGNRRRREGGEVLRWLGSPRLGFGTGYEFTHLAFDQHLLHGYFNPRQYVSQMGLAGVRFRVGKSFRGEYLARVGAESLTPPSSTIRDPYRLAWELTLRNRLRRGNWEAGGDYFYFRVAQDTGAFNAQAASLTLAYRF
jgi:hypothetical protein